MAPSTDMWLILLNDNDRDLRTWGVSPGIAAVVSKADDGPECRRINSNDVETFAGVDDVSVIVIHDEPAFCDKLLERLPADSRKVWIHFGETNSDAPSFTRQQMASDWQEIDLSRLKTLQNVRFNPFSMTSQTKWDRALQGLAAVFKKTLDGKATHKEELQRRISGLEEAWKWAEGYYDATQPFGAWVRAVFPLFLDTIGIELAQSRGVDTDEWRREALEGYRPVRQAITSDLRLGGEKGLLAGAEKILSAESENPEELKRLFQDCREASELLEWIDEQTPTTFHIPKERAQKLLALSSLLRRLEQHYAI